MLAVLELLLAAASTTNTAEKLLRLKDASAKIDMLKLLIRLTKDCTCVTNAQYLKIESLLHNAGKMLGGWIKSLG